MMMTYQPSGSARMASDESPEQKLKRLLEIYAIRARALSDAISALGWDLSDPAVFEAKIQEVKRLGALSERAGADFLDFVAQKAGRAAAASYGGRRPGGRPPTRLR